MKFKYIGLLLIICLIGSLVLCACTSKEAKIVIKHESKYSKLMKKKIPSHVIDLSDGKSVDFNYNFGPQDPSGPSFVLVTIDK